METEQVEIPPVDETLMESIEMHEDEGMESKELDHDSLVDEDEVQYPSEVIFPFSDNDVTTIFHTSQPTILVFAKFTQLYHVSLREEKEQGRVKNKSARENMKGEIKDSGTKRVIEVLRGKKRKKVRNGKRVKEKWCICDDLQVTMAWI